MTLQAKQVIEGLFSAFQPEKAEGIDAEVQVNLTGEGGGDWYLTIRDSKLSVLEGKSPSPRLTLTSTMQDFTDVAEGRVDPTAAFMQGKIKINGDIGLALRLVSFFKK